MPKAYSPAPQDIVDRVARLLKKNYSLLNELELRIDVLSATNTEPSKPAVSHQGCPALAVVSVVGPKQRAKGAGDAEIVVDELAYRQLKEPQRDALIDHELYHIEAKIGKDGLVKRDARNRPKIGMRKHDYQFGWFSEIARRHGMASMEALQAHRMVLAERQGVFAFLDNMATLEIESSEVIDPV